MVPRTGDFCGVDDGGLHTAWQKTANKNTKYPALCKYRVFGSICGVSESSMVPIWITEQREKSGAGPCAAFAHLTGSIL